MGRALKLLPMRVRARVRAFFTNAGIWMSTIVSYPLGTHCHPYLQPARWICHLARQQYLTQRNPLENTFPKDSSFLLLTFFFNVYLSYVASIYVMYLYSIFFPRQSQRKRSKQKGLVQFRLYNPDHLHAFRIIKSGNPQKYFGWWRFTKG